MIRVKVKVKGKGTMEEPFEPALSVPITFNDAKYEKGFVTIEIDPKDKEKIANDIVEEPSLIEVEVTAR